MPHCCGLCLYRFREEGWEESQARNGGGGTGGQQLHQVESDEDDDTESDGMDGLDAHKVWKGEDNEKAREAALRYKDVPKASIVDLKCGKSHVFHQRCLQLWVDGQGVNQDKFAEVYRQLKTKRNPGERRDQNERKKLYHFDRMKRSHCPLCDESMLDAVRGL